MTHRIVRSLLTVFVDKTASPTFDWTNLEPIALAQSYSLDVTVNTNSLVANDLADASGAAEWAVPEPSDKSWTLTTDSLVLIADTGNPEYDPTGKVINPDIINSLKQGDLVWVAIADSTATSGDTVPLYGQALITGYSQNGSIDEYHTYTASFTGSGELLDTFAIT
jgi:hypothetical protein